MKGLGFYGAAAQVIPIIAILLLVEVRVSPLGRRFYAIWALPWSLGGLAMAEVSCLVVLKSESDFHSVVYVITLAAIGAAVGLVAAWLGIYVGSARFLQDRDSADD